MRGFSGIMKQTGQKQIFQVEHNLVQHGPALSKEPCPGQAASHCFVNTEL